MATFMEPLSPCAFLGQALPARVVRQMSHIPILLCYVQTYVKRRTHAERIARDVNNMLYYQDYVQITSQEDPPQLLGPADINILKVTNNENGSVHNPPMKKRCFERSCLHFQPYLIESYQTLSQVRNILL